jgi:nicotinic acid mononucleotide adenylyltransferase
VRPRLVVRWESRRAPKSVGLLAGSFDPITVAHAATAEAALEHTELVLLIYSVRTLPKEGEPVPPMLSELERLAWLERFRASRERMGIGLASHGLLADHVVAAAERFPEAELFVVMGSDKLVQVLDPAWYEDQRAALGAMFDRARILYAVRAGDEAAVAQALATLDRLSRSRIETLTVGPEVASVSSRDVRERWRRGEDVSPLVPEEVRPLLAQNSRGS